jgi:hypothetical protein
MSMIVTDQARFLVVADLPPRPTFSTSAKFAVMRNPSSDRRSLEASLGAERCPMKFLQRMNEQPTSWALLGGVIAIIGYIVYLVGTGMNW